MSVITPVNVSSGGGGGSSQSTSPIITADMFYAIRESVDLAPNFSQTIIKVSVPAGKKALLHHINYVTTDQINARLTTLFFDGQQVNFLFYGSTSVNFVEQFGGPLELTDGITGEFATRSGATEPQTHRIHIFGKIVPL